MNPASEAADAIIGLMHQCDPCDVPSAVLVERHVQSAIEAALAASQAEVERLKAENADLQQLRDLITRFPPG